MTQVVIVLLCGGGVTLRFTVQWESKHYGTGGIDDLGAKLAGVFGAMYSHWEHAE